jgi:hypothetical protein
VSRGDTARAALAVRAARCRADAVELQIAAWLANLNAEKLEGIVTGGSDDEVRAALVEAAGAESTGGGRDG